MIIYKWNNKIAIINYKMILSSLPTNNTISEQKIDKIISLKMINIITINKMIIKIKDFRMIMLRMFILIVLM